MTPHLQLVAVIASYTQVNAAELVAMQTNAEAIWQFQYIRLPRNSITACRYDSTHSNETTRHGG